MKGLARWGAAVVLAALLVTARLYGAGGEGCILAERVFVQQRINSWSLAQRLGRADQAREVYASMRPGGEAHYYVLTARKGQRIQIRARFFAAQGQPALAPSLLLIGPGLKAPMPRGWPIGATGEGVAHSVQSVVARDAGGRRRGRYGPESLVDIRAPAHGRYILVVKGTPGGDQFYQLRFAGRCRYDAPTLLRAPVSWFRVGYLTAPRETMLQILLLAVVATALTAGWLWVRARRIQSRGGFVG